MIYATRTIPSLFRGYSKPVISRFVREIVTFSLYPFDRHRGGLMTGYGILLTFDSCIRYTSAVPVRAGCHQTARAEVSSHPHSSRSKYACGKRGDIICE